MDYEVWGFNDECKNMWLEWETDSRHKAIERAKEEQERTPHCHYVVVYDIDITIFSTK